MICSITCRMQNTTSQTISAVYAMTRIVSSALPRHENARLHQSNGIPKAAVTRKRMPRTAHRLSQTVRSALSAFFRIRLEFWAAFKIAPQFPQPMSSPATFEEHRGQISVTRTWFLIQSQSVFQILSFEKERIEDRTILPQSRTRYGLIRASIPGTGRAIFQEN